MLCNAPHNSQCLNSLSALAVSLLLLPSLLSRRLNASALEVLIAASVFSLSAFKQLVAGVRTPCPPIPRRCTQASQLVYISFASAQ